MEVLQKNTWFILVFLVFSPCHLSFGCSCTIRASIHSTWSLISSRAISQARALLSWLHCIPMFGRQSSKCPICPLPAGCNNPNERLVYRSRHRQSYWKHSQVDDKRKGVCRYLLPISFVVAQSLVVNPPCYWYAIGINPTVLTQGLLGIYSPLLVSMLHFLVIDNTICPAQVLIRTICLCQALLLLKPTMSNTQVAFLTLPNIRTICLSSPSVCLITLLLCYYCWSTLGSHDAQPRGSG